MIRYLNIMKLHKKTQKEQVFIDIVTPQYILKMTYFSFASFSVS